MQSLKGINLKGGKVSEAFLTDEMIVTSSPINGRCLRPKSSEFQTWANMLSNNCQELQENAVQDAGSSAVSDLSIEASFRVSPMKKIHVVSSSVKKKRFPVTPHKSYSQLSRVCRLKFEESDSDEDEIAAIKKVISTKDQLTLSEIESYERKTRKYIKSLERRKEHEQDNMDTALNCDLVKFVEGEIGQMNLSPSSARVLRHKKGQSDKRLLGLAVAKKMDTIKFRKDINQQMKIAQEQVKKREHQELKQIEASKLKKDNQQVALTFNKVHIARHKQKVEQARQKKQASKLENKLHSEQVKNSQQDKQIVCNVWSTVSSQQYAELQEQIRQQRQQQKDLVRQSSSQLERYKLSYEEKLKELKRTAEARAVDCKLEKEEISREMSKIQRSLRQQLEKEVDNLLNKIEHRGQHRRFLREEKESGLKERLTRGKYTFQL